MEMDGFAVYIRSSNLRFQLDKSRLGDIGPYIALKCVARINEVPEAGKEVTTSFYVPALEKTRNHLSLRSSGGCHPEVCVSKRSFSLTDTSVHTKNPSSSTTLLL